MRVVWLSDYSGKLVKTGYARVTDAILTGLHAKGHEVIEIGVGYQGYGLGRPWKVYPSNAYGGRLEGQDAAPLIAQEVQADVMVLLMDPPDTAWALLYQDRQGNVLPASCIEALDKRDFGLCMYSPVDAYCPDGKLPRRWAEIFRNIRTFDAVATPSRFAQNLLSECFARPVTYLPHGVDHKVFRPLGDPKAARERLGFPTENLTLLYVAVNKRRKMVPAFFETASKLIERIPSLVDGTHPVYKGLTLIFQGDDREDNFDLESLEKVYGLERPNVSTYRTENLTDGGLVLLDNAADLFLGLSGGEGFMVPAIEAQACRVPALVTSYSAMAEVVPDAEMGWCKVPPKALVPQPFNLMMWAWSDTDVAADRIQAFVEDRGLRMRLRKACWEYAQGFGWENIIPRAEAWLEEAASVGKARKNAVRLEAVTS